MSASQERASEPGAASADAAPVRESIGAYLAAQRQLRGISIVELAEQTRIPLRSLERLEAGSFDGDIDGFVRGFVRTVAEALGLDAEETLNRTLREPAGSGGTVSSRLSLRRVAATVAVVGLLGGIGFAAQLITASLRTATATAPGPRSPIVIRRDPVRDLAEAQGVASLAPAPAAALASRARRVAPPTPSPEAPVAGTGGGAAPAPAPDAVAAPVQAPLSQSEATPGVEPAPAAPAQP